MKQTIERMNFEYPNGYHKIITTSPIKRYSIFCTDNLIDTLRTKNTDHYGVGYNLSQFRLLCTKDVFERKLHIIDILWDIYQCIQNFDSSHDTNFIINCDHTIVRFCIINEVGNDAYFCLQFKPKYKTRKFKGEKLSYIDGCEFKHINAYFYPSVDAKDKAISIKLNDLECISSCLEGFMIETRQFQNPVDPYSIRGISEEKRIRKDDLITTGIVYSKPITNSNDMINSLKDCIHNLLNKYGIEHIRSFYDMAHKTYYYGLECGVLPYLFIVRNKKFRQVFVFYISKMIEKNEYIDIEFKQYKFKEEKNKE